MLRHPAPLDRLATGDSVSQPPQRRLGVAGCSSKPSGAWGPHSPDSMALARMRAILGSHRDAGNTVSQRP
ncbi:hypothetical protein NDU88_006464 [Pleurodeles waltl]|uniref:Uncharacterized protein n=1 Tax=Pleurodeles waltl TaxID=8319 RepID=A0AAV7NTC6_PLEWA|nr:hypothetical protein NDU88_006464 [Pleurodeles waltl]